MAYVVLRSGFAAVFALTVSACDGAQEGQSIATPVRAVSEAAYPPARFDGIGPIRAGMRLPEAAAALGDSVPELPRKNEPCNYVSFASMPRVAVMVIGDTIVRFDTDTLVSTEAGVRPGQAEDEVMSKYGARARVSPHHYTGPEGHYITVDAPGDTMHRIVFETDGKKVTTFRFGRKENVEWVEGCS